jgi:hypothetical protein
MSGGLLGLQTVIFPIITQVVSKAERHLHLHRDSCWRRGFNFGDEHLCHVMKCDRQQCRCRYRYEQLRVQIARAWTRLAVFQLIIYRPTKRTKCQYTFTCASLAETSVKASFLVIAICCAACLRAVDSIFSTKSNGGISKLRLSKRQTSRRESLVLNPTTSSEQAFVSRGISKLQLSNP